MRESRQDEIFEDCLSALLEGRRSIADSLSLYPSLVEDLKPLLETAAHVCEELRQQPLPQAQVQEQMRQRLIAGAGAHQRDSGSALWLDRRWAFLGSAFLVILASL